MAAISKQEYLKRYLSNSESGKKKKKRKVPKVASKRPTSIIVDDDITLEDVKVLDADQEIKEFEVDADEAPAVYEDDGVTTISIETFKKREEDQKNKWAPINKNTERSPAKEMRQKSSYDSHNSPPRVTKRRRQDTPDLSPQRGVLRDSPDHSPPRNGSKREEADNSPRRIRTRHDSGDSVPEETRNQLHLHDKSTQSRVRNDSPDLSPLRSGSHRDLSKRRIRNDSPDLSPPQSRSNRGFSSRKVRNDTPDLSPPWSESHRDLSKRRIRSDSPDLSPPRSETKRDSSARRVCYDSTDDSLSQPISSRDSSGRKIKNYSPDLSPPRSRMNRDSDHSLPRKRTKRFSESPPKKNANYDSDQSPPRKQNRPERASTTKNTVVRSGSEERMASGQKAGLLTASDLRIENERKRAQEAEMFSKMDPSVSGKGSETVYRDKMGRKKDVKMDRIKRREEERKEMEDNEKFMEWGRGVAQTKQNEEKVSDYLHEVNKPLARYCDDKDLEKMLKEKEREDDPMLAYMKQQKKKQDIKAGKKEKPVYKGPDPPPNRFNIRPGYRWDGVDRSNGFERKRFAMLANKMASQTQAYKWSTEDM